MPENKLEHNFNEQIARPDRALEQYFENSAATVESEVVDPPTDTNIGMSPVTARPVATQESYRDERLKAIESILEEDLADLFIQLPDASKRAFKTEGEITARKISALMSETKIAVQRIVDLIRNWLSFLPGVNKFFIEQEVKIKTDKIIAIK